jgi:hypothetical protein
MREANNTIKVELTVTELELLTTLAGDQLFRREFIDPKMPGYRADNNQTELIKSLLARLRNVVAQHRPVETAHLGADRTSVASRAAKRASPFNNRSDKR